MSTELYSERKSCRLCHKENLKTAFEMVAIPRGDGYTKTRKVEPQLPLDINFCTDCGHVQTAVDVHQGYIYDHYLWTTSISPGLTKSYQAYVEDVTTKYFKDKKGFSVELGSNDGTFSLFLKEKGFKTLGIDPAKNLATLATEKGVETWPRYFNKEVAAEVIAKHGKADLVVANHMFANINDVQVITDGVKDLLSKDGLFVIQVFYLYDVVKDKLLENFNHEHPSYYYTKPLKSYFEANGFEMIDVARVAAKGGSLRCFLQLKGGPRAKSKSVEEYIAREEALKLDKLSTYEEMATHIRDTRKNFKDFFEMCRREGKTVAAYGTSIGATVFTYQYELGNDLKFFVDDDPIRHNLLTPGFNIPVYETQSIYEMNPDYVVIMAPLYADIIMQKHQDFLRKGGSFVKFRPHFEIIRN